jgi:hypothetical protein
VTENLRRLRGFFQELEDGIVAFARSLEQKFFMPIENSVQQSGNAAGVAEGLPESLPHFSSLSTRLGSLTTGFNYSSFSATLCDSKAGTPSHTTS